MNLVRTRSSASLLRVAAIGSCLALGLSAFGGGTAGATITPATGTVTCGVSGVGAFNHGIPVSGQPATAKWTMEKIHQVSLTSCVTNVTGGRSAVTGGVLQVNARLDAGASCDSLAASLLGVNKAVVMVKLQNIVSTSVTDPITGTTTTTTTSTSATVHVKIVSPTQVSQAGSDVVLTGVAPQSSSGNKPFGGETVTVQLHSTPLVGDCTTTPLTQVDLTGSTVSIQP